MPLVDAQVIPPILNFFQRGVTACRLHTPAEMLVMPVAEIMTHERDLKTLYGTIYFDLNPINVWDLPSLIEQIELMETMSYDRVMIWQLISQMRIHRAHWFFKTPAPACLTITDTLINVNMRMNNAEYKMFCHGIGALLNGKLGIDDLVNLTTRADCWTKLQTYPAREICMYYDYKTIAHHDIKSMSDLRYYVKQWQSMGQGEDAIWYWVWHWKIVYPQMFRSDDSQHCS